jgi:hypothetical protein
LDASAVPSARICRLHQDGKIPTISNATDLFVATEYVLMI